MAKKKASISVELISARTKPGTRDRLLADVNSYRETDCTTLKEALEPFGEFEVDVHDNGQVHLICVNQPTDKICLLPDVIAPSMITGSQIFVRIDGKELTYQFVHGGARSSSRVIEEAAEEVKEEVSLAIAEEIGN